MARTRCVMFLTDYGQDFDALPPLAQWLYQKLLRQPTLSLAGCLQVSPARWRKIGQGVDVVPLIDALEEARWIAVDELTEEVVLPRHLAHDVTRGNFPTTTLKGVWSAWEAIESAHLRRVVAVAAPSMVFDRAPDSVPVEAMEMRRSAPMEPSVLTGGRDHPSAPDVAAVGAIRPSPSPSPSPSPAIGPDRPLPAVDLDPNDPRLEPSPEFAVAALVGPPRVAELRSLLNGSPAARGADAASAGGAASPTRTNEEM